MINDYFKHEGRAKMNNMTDMTAKEYMDTLTAREIEAMKAAIYCAGEEATDEYLLHNIENDYISINTTRSGRDVAWYIDGDDHSGCVYVDTLDALTEEEIKRELC